MSKEEKRYVKCRDKVMKVIDKYYPMNPGRSTEYKVSMDALSFEIFRLGQGTRPKKGK